MKKIMLSALLLSLPLMSYARQFFPAPEAAAEAFAAAVAQQNKTQLTALLGDNWQQYLPADGADAEAVARFNRDWQVRHHIVLQGDTAYLNVGQEDWQLPIPLVKTDRGWRFDMVAAQEEILTRTIGRNELSAIQAMHAYVDAQYDYWQRTQTFARKLVSSEGRQDGLYWPVKPGETPSPLGPAFTAVASGAGYHGYHFRMIKSQKADSFALLAWPVVWGETGVMSFMVNQDDNVWQANLGQDTEKKVQEIDSFATDSAWQIVSQ
ncbi:TPA: DUF2950 family protein [Citrobacter freundii]